MAGSTRTRRRDQARRLRKVSTAAERKVWDHLRDRQVQRHKFRRQHSIGPFVVDFVCLDRKLIVEVDGEPHEHSQRIAADIARDHWLEAQGFRILRINNSSITDDMVAVLTRIERALPFPP